MNLVVRVPGHSVIAIGVRDGVDIDSITPADILVVDPGDGKVKTADQIYSGWTSGTHLTMQDNSGWSLRIPTQE